MSIKERYKRLVINIKSVAMAKPYEKHIIVDNAYIVADERYFPFLMRWYTGDNRHNVVEFLRLLTEEIHQFLDKDSSCSPDMRVKIIQLLPSYRSGLDFIKITYSTDRIMHLTIESMIDQVDELLAATSTTQE